MALSTRIVQLALLGLSGLAGYSFYTVLIPQGLQDDLKVFADKKLLPDSTVSVDGLYYTGFGPVDHIINILNYFFWPILHDTDYVRGARSKMFIGQFMTGWTLVMLESERPGNKGRIMSYVVVWGLATQAMGYAFAMPIWMAITIGANFISRPTAVQIVPESRAGRAIPWAVLVGFLLPGVLAYLPAPGVWTHKQKMVAMASWQVFPIWTSIAQQLIKRILPDYAVEQRARKASGWQLSSSLKSPYIFVLIVAGLIRVGSIARIVYDIQYSNAPGAPTWDIFRQLLIPGLLDPTQKYDVLAAGSAAFLEWDETVGQAALLLYSAFQCFKVWRPKDASGWAFVLLGLPLTWSVFGSSGVAVAYLATRDDFVIRKSEKTKKLKQ